VAYKYYIHPDDTDDDCVIEEIWVQEPFFPEFQEALNILSEESKVLLKDLDRLRINFEKADILLHEVLSELDKKGE